MIGGHCFHGVFNLWGTQPEYSKISSPQEWPKTQQRLRIICLSRFRWALNLHGRGVIFATGDSTYMTEDNFYYGELIYLHDL
jgi:hypothetical protein